MSKPSENRGVTGCSCGDGDSGPSNQTFSRPQLSSMTQCSASSGQSTRTDGKNYCQENCSNCRNSLASPTKCHLTNPATKEASNKVGWGVYPQRQLESQAGHVVLSYYEGTNVNLKWTVFAGGQAMSSWHFPKEWSSNLGMPWRKSWIALFTMCFPITLW